MKPSQSIFKLKNEVQNYPWGSTTSIPQLFCINNDENQPIAEIWMGAHPKASSAIKVQERTTLLSNFIEEHKVNVLGETAAKQFGELPFLFKVLAAEKALSIQVHPSKSQAESGYKKENSLGISLTASDRNYKDSNHKPELVYALTSYLAMNGFRPFVDILSQFEGLNSTALREDVNEFSKSLDSDGLAKLFKTLLELSGTKKQSAISELLAWAETEKDPVGKLILELNDQYPNDAGLFAPLLLNVIELKPGEAMFLDAGTPHAYLRGTALEIMANSDNVLRAGLTPKFIDTDELISCCKFKPLNNWDILTEPSTEGCESIFYIPVDDFNFAIYENPFQHVIEPKGAEIWFAIDSDATFVTASNEEVLLTKGESVFIPHYCGQLTVTTKGKLARAFY
ncbi:mannose-6-phosphate isomerase, class I [Vibrio hannami]|uniref:mannose-6-phosphate isomerase, class I n=1 Tax=Vibrio hannami TaxID=2717094 RepID=UPI0024108173|nr:mannose-6-phosphate isomerase, class I [Vibrio hannami]MDG3085303.1 mannose-6-phosphate isomerase, class I [Vibrio hannami]